tara:strand:- start:242 stop:445 length:204 start_codon:yes stop_codon:yes gene_type:complete
MSSANIVYMMYMKNKYYSNDKIVNKEKEKNIVNFKNCKEIFKKYLTYLEKKTNKLFDPNDSMELQFN